MSITMVTPERANVKLTLGQGWFEAVCSDRPFGYGYGEAARRGKGGSPFSPPLNEERKRANRERANRRAKSEIRKKVKVMASAGAIAFLTVTYRENMQDYEQWVRDWHRFVDRVREEYPAFKYVCVAEKQRRGAWHAHVLTNLFIPHKEWEALWGKGFVWVARANDTRHAIRYITKYIVKGMQEVPEGRKRYLCSQGLADEMKVIYAVGTVAGILKYLEDKCLAPSVEAEFVAEEEGFTWLEGILEGKMEGFRE